MTILVRLAATAAAMTALAFAASACSPKTPAPDQVAANAHAAPATASTAPAAAGALPAPCQALMAQMQSCSDNLTKRGSPLGNQIRLSMEDMRTAIADAPPAEVSSFCQTEANAFAQRAQQAQC